MSHIVKLLAQVKVQTLSNIKTP